MKTQSLLSIKWYIYAQGIFLNLSISIWLADGNSFSMKAFLITSYLSNSLLYFQDLLASSIDKAAWAWTSSNCFLKFTTLSFFFKILKIYLSAISFYFVKELFRISYALAKLLFVSFKSSHSNLLSLDIFLRSSISFSKSWHFLATSLYFSL